MSFAKWHRRVVRHGDQVLKRCEMLGSCQVHEKTTMQNKGSDCYWQSAPSRITDRETVSYRSTVLSMNGTELCRRNSSAETLDLIRRAQRLHRKNRAEVLVIVRQQAHETLFTSSPQSGLDSHTAYDSCKNPRSMRALLTGSVCLLLIPPVRLL